MYACRSVIGSVLAWRADPWQQHLFLRGLPEAV